MAEKKPIKQPKTKKHLAREQREAKQTRIIVLITILFGVIIVGFVVYGLVDQLIVKPNTPVAKIGETTIRVKEFQTQVQYQRVQALNTTYQYYSYYQQFGDFGQSFLQTAQSIASQLAQPEVFGRDVLDGMIDNELVKEEAAKRGITVSEEEIDARLQASFNFFPDGTQTPTATATVLSTPTYSPTQLALVTLTPTPTQTEIPTDTPEVTPTSSEVQATQSGGDQTVTGEPTKELPPTLTPVPTITPTPTPYTTQIYGDNLDEFAQLYKTYNFTLDDLREIIRTNLLREKLIEDVTKDLVPFKEEVWARHILVATEEEALQVENLLKEGGDFAALAAEYSTDESNNMNGGDLGWFDKEAMVPEFTEVAFSLGVGEISDPVETEYGFHIIQVLGHRESQIPAREFAQDKQSAFTDWLSELRSSRDDIVIYDAWQKYVPDTPAVPDQLLAALFQSQLQTVPTIAP